jgi:hypothetical protein
MAQGVGQRQAKGKNLKDRWQKQKSERLELEKEKSFALEVAGPRFSDFDAAIGGRENRRGGPRKRPSASRGWAA